VLADRAPTDTPLPDLLRAGLVRLGLAEPDDLVTGHPLTGGVASDIWRADLASGPVCVKRALERLRVEAEWVVPTTRTANEAAWLREAARLAPGAACPVIGFAEEERVLVLAWLDPADHTNWKADLASGIVDRGVAGVVGQRLARLHHGFADPAAYAGPFAAADLFRALRLDPYLGTTADRHPRHAATLRHLAERTARAGHSVIHGDVSPKNVLVGPRGPLLVDAECASWGDPAFDLAFCANHLLLKAVWHPALATQLRDAFDRLCDGYLAGVSWEPIDELEGRAASLLPALALARVDGSSPVEYLDEAEGRPTVRRRAEPLLRDLPTRLADVADRWFADSARPTPTGDPAR
jgi:fructosamine-3-kinase